MKLAIATPAQAPNFMPLHTEFLTPVEIRAMLQDLIDVDYNGDVEIMICTMDRTVLDTVTHENAKNVGHMTYEDVLIYKDGSLVPLLELHNADWLSHFMLGDLFSYNKL